MLFYRPPTTFQMSEYDIRNYPTSICAILKFKDGTVALNFTELVRLSPTFFGRLWRDVASRYKSEAEKHEMMKLYPAVFVFDHKLKKIFIEAVNNCGRNVPAASPMEEEYRDYFELRF